MSKEKPVQAQKVRKTREVTPKISDDVYQKAIELASVLAPSFSVTKYEAVSGAVRWLHNKTFSTPTEE